MNSGGWNKEEGGNLRGYKELCGYSSIIPLVKKRRFV